MAEEGAVVAPGASPGRNSPLPGTRSIDYLPDPRFVEAVDRPAREADDMGFVAHDTDKVIGQGRALPGDTGETPAPLSAEASPARFTDYFLFTFSQRVAFPLPMPPQRVATA